MTSESAACQVPRSHDWIWVVDGLLSERLEPSSRISEPELGYRHGERLYSLPRQSGMIGWRPLQDSDYDKSGASGQRNNSKTVDIG
jgi:hypothetical protein